MVPTQTYIWLQSLLGWLTQQIELGNSALCHPVVTFLQFHSVVPGVLLGTLWLLSGLIRLKELKRQRRRAFAKLPHDGGRGSYTRLAEQEVGSSRALPGVSIILPVRGCRSHSLSNWSSVLGLHYDGPLEFIFVLESKLDPAHAAITQLLLKQCKSSSGSGSGGDGGGGGGSNPGSPSAGSGVGVQERTHRVVFSGPASKTSQKIHNLIAGIRAATPENAYALCLDDDVQLQPALLTSLVRDMEDDPSLFMATGYPFDVPPPDANLLTYCVMSYHLPLVIAFSVRQRIEFVWGGCQLFRLAGMQADSQGVIKAWEDGGYSDDLTVASKCTEQGLVIYCPSYAIFPQWVDGDYSFRRWWNYLRRQLYVLDTYATSHNRRTNHIMALLHCYGSWGWVLPATTVMARLVLWLLAVVLLPTQNVYGGPQASSYLWLQLFGLDGCKHGVASLVVFLVFTTYMMCTLWWMTGVILSLFRQLNPGLKPRRLETFSWWKVWAGFYTSNALIPLCMAYTFLNPHINWAGIRYTRRRGKVYSVRHGS